MWWIGLVMCIIALLSLTQDQKFIGGLFWFAFILAGLAAMWVAQ